MNYSPFSRWTHLYFSRQFHWYWQQPNPKFHGTCWSSGAKAATIIPVDNEAAGGPLPSQGKPQALKYGFSSWYQLFWFTEFRAPCWAFCLDMKFRIQQSTALPILPSVTNPNCQFPLSPIGDTLGHQSYPPPISPLSSFCPPPQRLHCHSVVTLTPSSCASSFCQFWRYLTVTGPVPVLPTLRVLGFMLALAGLGLGPQSPSKVCFQT